MPIAGSNINLDSTEGMDKISQTEKVTTPYFSNGATELLATNVTSSTHIAGTTNDQYFFGVSHTDTPTTEEFNVAFGSTRGFGSLVQTNTKSETAAIYGQYASLLLGPTEVTGGFIISRNNSLATVPTNAKVASGRDTEIFVMAAKRSNMKDRLNKGSWTIKLSGSKAPGDTGEPILHLCDDSVGSNPTPTPVGDRYNIVSGSSGAVSGSGAADRTFGFFYPDMGVMIFSAAELSSSIPGKGANTGDTVIFDKGIHKGFGFPTTTNANRNTALRFVNCLQPAGASLTFRDEEDQVSAQYFCRVRSAQMNFSNNPTFVSGSLNELRHTKMKGNPQTFISSVQLYNQSGDIVAVGNLSTPLKKNFSSEATIKVKLTY